MSDAVVRTPAEPAPEETRNVLAAVSAPLVPTEANDNERNDIRQLPEPRMFELPRGIWVAMVGSYTVFLTALLFATGGSRAAFAIAISAVYVAMFFGVARVMLNQSNPQPQSPIKQANGRLETAFGPLRRQEVYAQVLIVPVAVAMFGIGIAVIATMIV